MEGNSFADYGLYNNLRFWLSLAIGISGAIVHIIIVYGLESLWGWLQWHGENIAQLKSAIGPIFLLAIWISATEEVVFRGFLLTQLNQDYPITIAAAISSLIFALLHLAWEQKETIPQLPGLWLMGMVLVVARIADHNNLGLAIGLHTGWIWVLSSLDSAKLISSPAKVPSWLTGIGEKPLAGVAGILGLLATGVIIWGLGMSV
jgi:membrane protease YdiL (CAAX protease family)